MGNLLFLGSDLFTWVIIPALIALARVCDVSLGTIRIITIGRGYKVVAPFLGFFEILIWLLAMRQIMQNLTNVLYYLAYAGGFAAGTFVGMYIEEKLALGIVSVRIITQKEASELIDFLRSADYGVTSVDAQGATGPVHVIYTIVNRSSIPDIIDIINRFNPKAFDMIEALRRVREGVFPLERSPGKRDYLHLLKLHRKGR